MPKMVQNDPQNKIKIQNFVNFYKKIDLEIDFLIEKSISRFKKTGQKLRKIVKSAENANLPRITVKNVEGHTA